MARLVASGRVADLIAALMLLEMGVLTLVFRRTGRGVPPAELATGLAAGMALLFALRTASTASGWRFTAAWLMLALVAHLSYLALRFGARRS